MERPKGSDPPTPPTNKPWRERARWAADRFRRHAGEPVPPDSTSDDRRSIADRLLWGLAQPFLGLRLLIAHPSLLRQALVPTALVALLCAGVASLDEDFEHETWLQRFYLAFVALAPVPPVIFAKHYARLAARASTLMGWTDDQPYIRTVRQSLTESVLQVATIAIGMVPITLVLGLIPFIGTLGILAVSGVWALHWIVIEALDSARTLPAGQTVADMERRATSDAVGTPWFVRLYQWPPSVPAALRSPLRAWGRTLDRMTRHWRAEIALAERQPATAIGFSLGAGLLVALPGLNLLFRPALIVGAAHVRARLEHTAVPTPSLPDGTSLPAPVENAAPKMQLSAEP